MDRSANRHRSGVVCLALACLLGCGGAMTEVDESSSPGDASFGASSGGQGALTRGGTAHSVTGTSAMAGNGAGGYATIVLPPAGGAAADYRCARPVVDTGEPCAVGLGVATQVGIFYDMATGDCASAAFYSCGNSTLGATFSTRGGCAAACQGKGSSNSCAQGLPVAGTTCGQEPELCIYQAASGSLPCLCSDFGCTKQDCSHDLPIVDAFSGSCQEGLCVAESPILFLVETKTVCRCSAGTWECEEFRHYD